MKLRRPGKNTLEVEILNISLDGVWLYAKGSEYFLSYKDFPWFKNATVAEIHNVRLLHSQHLCWEDLDVDLELDSLKDLDRYPLKYKSAA